MINNGIDKIGVLSRVGVVKHQGKYKQISDEVIEDVAVILDNANENLEFISRVKMDNSNDYVFIGFNGEDKKGYTVYRYVLGRGLSWCLSSCSFVEAYEEVIKVLNSVV